MLSAPSFKLCSRSSPNLAGCVKESIEFIRPSLKSGDFGNGFKIDPLEPLPVDDIVIKRGAGLYMKFTNMKGNGAMDFKVNKIRFNADPFKVDMVLEIPRMEVFGKYNLDLSLGIIKLKGDGDAKANIGKRTAVVLSF